MQSLPLTPYPGVVLDNYRISGFLSDKYDQQTYRNFFRLDDQQIAEHLTGKPIRLKGLHRYQNRAALLFHEMTHWLGHVHSAIYPDLAHLYETCCFAGSDHISDAEVSRQFQSRACNILRDDKLWSANRLQQMHLWRHKRYDQLKRNMRERYD